MPDLSFSFGLFLIW